MDKNKLERLMKEMTEQLEEIGEQKTVQFTEVQKLQVTLSSTLHVLSMFLAQHKFVNTTAMAVITICLS